ncbi:hypothetical protein E4P40_23865 [Blastococcus sp. CT_GayMR20]|uniref:hypothetical protein n=1 Tax=Blastococcus sp. CT_GayMR20 TaxID=2559609 RepID=UPI00107342D4|nr:hypothetical protein [Blastococcus sp. CT_GayMR20]TFV67964.1 hypothetical protein E4P40_23865 [Blastococcus sp. CT_GayMR20]
MLALLLFFGVKEGVLDQALRQYPQAALAVVLFLGGGLLASLFAPALRAGVLMRFWAVLVAVAAMMLVAAMVLPDILRPPPPGQTELAWWQITLALLWAFDVLALVVALVWIIGRGPSRVRLSISTTVALIAVLIAWVLWRGFPHPDDDSAGNLALSTLSSLSMVAAALAVPFAVSSLLEVQRKEKEDAAANRSQTVKDADLAKRESAKRKSAKRQAQTLLVAAPIVILLAGSYLLRDVEAPTVITSALVLLFVIAIAWAYVRDVTIPFVAAVIILGVTATALGLYGASKLSVQSKLAAINPRVTAVFMTVDGTPVVQIHALAGRMSKQNLVVRVHGTPRPLPPPPDDDQAQSGEDGDASPPARQDRKSFSIWTSLLQPDGLDSIDEVVNVPLLMSRWEEVTVSHCVVDVSQGRKCPTEDAHISKVLQADNPRGGLELTGHITAESAGALEVTVAGTDIAPGTTLQVSVCRQGAEGRPSYRLAFATLSADPDGKLTWNPEVPAGEQGDTLVLHYAECLDGSCGPNAELARYTLP